MMVCKYCNKTVTFRDIEDDRAIPLASMSDNPDDEQEETEYAHLACHWNAPPDFKGFRE